MDLTAVDIETLKTAVHSRRRELIDELAHTEKAELKPPLRQEIERLEWLEMKLEEARPGPHV